MTTTKNKQSLGKHIRQLLTEYPSVVLSHMSGEIMLQLEQTDDSQSAAVVLLYHSLPDEVNTHAFISRWYQHKTLLLPRVDEDRLSLHQYTGPDCLSEGKWNIQEPDEPAFTDYRQISLAIVPGVAFDTAGHRLGRGKGYYDRLLSTRQMAHVQRIGVAFPFQVMDSIPYEAHDMIMHQVITCTQPDLTGCQ